MTQYKEPVERIFSDLKQKNEYDEVVKLLHEIKEQSERMHSEIAQKLETLDAGQVIISQRLFHIEKELEQLKKQKQTNE